MTFSALIRRKETIFFKGWYEIFLSSLMIPQDGGKPKLSCKIKLAKLFLFLET